MYFRFFVLVLEVCVSKVGKKVYTSIVEVDYGCKKKKLTNEDTEENVDPLDAVYMEDMKKAGLQEEFLNQFSKLMKELDEKEK